MKQLLIILITTTVVVLLAGCGKRERTHDLLENKSKPLEIVHPYQKIISKQAVGIPSKADGIQVGENVNPEGKASLQGTSLVGMLSDHFSVLKSSPDKFSGSNSFLPNIPELIDHWKSTIKETNEPHKRFFLKLAMSINGPIRPAQKTRTVESGPAINSMKEILESAGNQCLFSSLKTPIHLAKRRFCVGLGPGLGLDGAR